MSKFRFRQKAMKFRSRKSAILERMANNAVNYFKVEVFDKRSFDGRRWKPNKVQDGRQQLVRTGRTRQSIRVLSRTADSVKVGTDVPYAKYLNEGTDRMPARKFIGKSKELIERNNKYLLSEVNRIA